MIAVTTKCKRELWCWQACGFYCDACMRGFIKVIPTFETSASCPHCTRTVWADHSYGPPE